MHYSTISSDLELVSALNRLFFVKKQHQTTPIKLIRQQANNYQITPSRNNQNGVKATQANLSSISREKLNRSPMNCQVKTPSCQPLITESTVNRTSDRNILDTETDYRSSLMNCSRNLNKAFQQPKQNFRLQQHQFRQKEQTEANRLSNIINSPDNNRNQSQNKIYIRRRVSTDSFVPLKRNNNFISLTNPDEIIILDSKVSILLSIILKRKNPAIPCCDLWSFYINSSFQQNQEDFFNKPSTKVIIRSASHLMMLVIILSYDISFELELLIQLNMLFKTIFTLLQLNFLLIAKHVMKKLDQRNSLISQFTQNLKQRIDGESEIEMNESNLCNIIRHNCTSIVDLIQLILNNIQQPNETYKEMMFNFYNISHIETSDLMDFFNRKIFREDMQSMRSILVNPSYFTYSYPNQIPQPYLPRLNLYANDNRPMRKYTLCLGLDEVLISFAFIAVNDNEENRKGIMHPRPGMNKFLSIISQMYELVLFTSATKGYVEPIIKGIEKNNKIFDYCLYREHCSLILNEYIKDISKLGRDLSKIIIIDNNAKSFKMHKDNGIVIQSYFGNEYQDNALEKLLNILIKIEKDNSDSDVRQLLVKYHNDITQTVSSNLNVNSKDDSDLILIQHNNCGNNCGENGNSLKSYYQ